MRRERTNLIDFTAAAAPVRWWNRDAGHRTKPTWYVGHPSIGVMDIQHDVRNAEDWAWLIQQIHQLRAMYEARTGREIPEKATPWYADRDAKLKR